MVTESSVGQNAVLPPETESTFPHISRVVRPAPDIETANFFGRLEADQAFGEIESELKEQLTAHGLELTGFGDYDSEELFARERSFFTKVFTAAISMAERRPGEVNILFDMDYTLVHNNAVRPSFDLLVRQLDAALGERLQIGVLSNRHAMNDDDETLKQRIVADISDTKAAGKLNPNLIISSRRRELADPRVNVLLQRGTDPAAQIAAAKNVLDPEIVESMYRGDVSPSMYDSKLVILNELVTEHPDDAFILVDDLPYAYAIDQNSDHVRGVPVEAEILDTTMWRFRNEIPKALQAA